MSIYCLSFEGGPLNDPIRNLLFDTAQGMMDEAVEARTVKTSTGEGEVTTENEQASMGAIYGTVFHAILIQIGVHLKSIILFVLQELFGQRTVSGRVRIDNKLANKQIGYTPICFFIILLLILGKSAIIYLHNYA